MKRDNGGTSRWMVLIAGLALLFGAEAAAQVDYSMPGPDATTVTTGSRCTIFHPADLGAAGTLHPVILWGNGTWATPESYATGLHHWASWGFIVAAADTTQAGTGLQMLHCLDYLESLNGRFFSPFFQRVDTGSVGTSGHSQGGGGSIMAATDPRIDASAPMQPYVTGLGHLSESWDLQQGPMFLMSGGMDTVATIEDQQQPVYDGVDVPVFWGILEPADHFEPSVDFGGYAGPSTAWFLWQLAGDAAAAELFTGEHCTLCGDPLWTVHRRDID